MSELDGRVYLCVVVNVKKFLDWKERRDTKHTLQCFEANRLVQKLAFGIVIHYGETF